MFDVRYTNDIVLLIWIALVAVFGKGVTKKKVTVLGCEEERHGLLFATIVFFPIFWFVTTVFMRGDMYAYSSGYNNFSSSVSEVLSNWGSIGKGAGYSLLVAISKSMGVSDFQGFRVVVALLQSIPLVIVYSRYSEDYIYSIFLFIATMCYEGWMMNGIRQFLAACLIFLTVPLLMKNNYVLSVLLIFAAITVHQSAIIMIPVLLLSYMKPWGKVTMIAIVIFAVILYYYIGHSDWLTEEELQQSQGSNPLGILFRSLPAVIAFWGRKQIAKANNRMVNMLVNIAIITVAVNVVSSQTSGIMTGRLMGYLTIYSYLLYPYLLTKVFDEKVSHNLQLILTLFYSSIFLYDLYGT